MFYEHRTDYIIVYIVYEWGLNVYGALYATKFHLYYNELNSVLIVWVYEFKQLSAISLLLYHPHKHNMMPEDIIRCLLLSVSCS